MNTTTLKRYIFLFSILGVLFVPNMFAQKRKTEVVEQPRLVFDTTEYYFGKIPERGKKVSYDYEFTNTGDAPLVITRSIVSCKCMNVNFSRKPILPGEKGLITVTYNPRKQQGMFYKAIQIFSNAPEGVHIIIAKGMVTVEEE